jgi:lipopolysaccharide/colanic/teichoic acid biosynthesis glycosyltransferase
MSLRTETIRPQDPQRTSGQVPLPDVPEVRDARHIVAIGAPADLPRAFQHPAVVEGRLVIDAALAVEIDPEGYGAELEQLSALLRAHEVSAILVAGPVGHRVIQRIADLALLHDCDLLAVMPTEIVSGHDPVVVWSGHAPFVQLAQQHRSAFEVALKRTIDVVGALVGLVLAAPLLLVLCVLVSLESPGAPIFRHERVGKGGRKFRCLKLRTMRADAEEMLRRDPVLFEEYRRWHYKLPEEIDPRTTRLGRFLRSTSMDELPQLWNVLTGEMSLVGPRPVVQDELSQYREFVELFVSVRPGLTGAWAVSGRHEVGYPERCAIELNYVRHWTVSGDLRVIFRTIGVVARGFAPRRWRIRPVRQLEAPEVIEA